MQLRYPEPACDRSLDPLELVELTTQWGAPVVAQVALTVAHPFLTGANQLLTKPPRRAEICYLMHRGDPQAELLLHRKTFYPPGAYRLPTGGVQVGERVADALAREVWEETGLRVTARAAAQPGAAVVQGLPGVLAYDLLHRQLGPVAFATYFFLLRMPRGAELRPQDPDEQIDGWAWTTAGGLRQVAETLETVGTRVPSWRDWGRFRAAGHRFVAQLLGA